MQESEDSAWDDSLARDLIGRRVLVGLSFYRRDGELERREQFCCRVRSASRSGGIEIEIEDGEEASERRRLPPDTRPFQRAQPGLYRLKSAEALVVDPDYLCLWDIKAPAE